MIGSQSLKLFMSVLIILPVVILQAQPLRQVVESALQSNATVRAQGAAVEQSDWEVKSAWRKTLPTIDFDASYRHVTEVGELQLPPILGQPGRTVKLGAYDTYETTLSANYLLFSGFAQRASVNSKEAQKDLSENSLRKTEKDIAFQVVAGYRQVQLHQLEASALEAGRKRIQLQLDRLKSLVRQGMALATDTLSMALAALSYDQRILVTQSKMETAQQELGNLVGSRVEVAPPPEQLPAEKHESLDLNLNENLKNLTIQKEIIDHAKTIRQSGYYPRIALQAGLKYGKPGAAFIGNDWMLYGVWGVGVQWNLWSWRGDRAAVEAQEAAIRKVEFNRSALQDKVKTRYDNALREYHSLKKQLKVSQSALKLAKDKMAVIESRYRQGMASATDFNDTNLELTEAQINYKKQLLFILLKISEIDYISSKPISEWSI